jgi:hypothetical protein
VPAGDPPGVAGRRRQLFERSMRRPAARRESLQPKMRDLFSHQPPPARRRAPAPKPLGAVLRGSIWRQPGQIEPAIYKAIGTRTGYGGHFRALQGFKYIGERELLTTP